jgi:hypothetical protein
MILQKISNPATISALVAKHILAMLLSLHISNKNMRARYFLSDVASRKNYKASFCSLKKRKTTSKTLSLKTLAFEELID